MERHEKIQIVIAKFFHESRDINPYASADTMRVLDGLIRSALADNLARAASAWRDLYQKLSRDFGVPTRDNPFPDASRLAEMKSVKGVADELSEWVSRIHALEAPAHDRAYHRIRDNDQLLELLIETDYQLASIAAALERLCDTLQRDNRTECAQRVDEQLKFLHTVVRERDRCLSPVS